MGFWTPPTEDVYKVNVDGSFVPEINHGSTCGVIRNFKGEVIAGFARPLPHCSSVEYAEAMALLHGIDFAFDIGIQDLVVEGDCLHLISEISSSHEDFSVVGHIVDEIKMGSVRFNSWACHHVRRSANGVAHELACFALAAPSDLFWMEFLPSRFQAALDRDSLTLGGRQCWWTS
uniref:RNase H type-1 domain-containing protein n=1 Tax=Davidia involucrata TaxID=16924 RepID=A0A5B7BLL9_DAVIN